MPGIIDSAPDCVIHEQVDGTDEASVAANGEDSADFVVGNNYLSEETPCAGFMTFGPGSTYGDDGSGANGAYMALTWIGIVVMVAVLIGWIVYENKRLVNYVRSAGRS
ncbi:MAG: hypothetical protein M3M99_01085 [Actinomycetota bacterium]|nr:hypothetical protein [Actinomycetota bacterium]